ncbi:MAG TPA: non-canonical purine NTP pyrophosphatase [Gemmatimonadaceae bacterium]|nr:non-canonical purine NTP pyrophosphatase [Gemmatimonadaceae bacterium]
MSAQRAGHLSGSQSWVIATRSSGKLRELRPIFASAGIDVIDLAEAMISEEPDEAGIEIFDTFEANALAKARYFHARSGGRDIVADDSGLEVLALGGAPGVRSKRWSEREDLNGAALDAANNALLIERLRDVSDRRARFVCAAAWCGAAGSLVVRGTASGAIVERPAGTHGFGYDPYFYSDQLGMTLAEATVEQKQLVSHRGRAFAELISVLRERGVLDEPRA